MSSRVMRVIAITMAGMMLLGMFAGAALSFF